MSRNKSMENGVRIHIWLEQSDWDFIKDKWDDNVGASAAVRSILHNFIEKLKARANERAESIGSADEQFIESTLRSLSGEPGSSDGEGPANAD